MPSDLSKGLGEGKEMGSFLFVSLSLETTVLSISFPRPVCITPRSLLRSTAHRNL